MDEHQHDGEVIRSFFEEQQEIFDSSTQAIYAFLDDDCRVANEKFASLLGYSSPDEWFKVDVHESFPDAFVAEDSQHTLVTAYQNAMQNMEASTIEVTWKKKSGGTVDSTVVIVPIVHKEHLIALHFIS